MERGSSEARALWNTDSVVVASWIAFAEVSSAIVRARRAGRISSRKALSASRSLDAEWSTLSPIETEAVTGRYAGELAARHGLRGMDAIHLASALLVAAADPVMVTWDAELRGAAAAEGLAVAV